ncbi:MAG: HD domain-containing protein [Deltaproteobacteria bacterium]|nr:HD domain-containing protein [Deltaproteobacteria bacterium]
MALDEAEEKRLSKYACLSKTAVRRVEEENIHRGHRQNFSLDTDRILHSMAYSRYIDKTQVFYLVKNDHITHRVLHVQLVSKISRTIGRLLMLNEDLIEAIALGHDIGHAPFGHDGERFLSRLSSEHGIGFFQHNLQSVRFLEKIERKGRGWNLTLQVLDGILCHDGEIHKKKLCPESGKNFEIMAKEISEKEKEPYLEILPMTLEGCVVRMADTISYVGRDIEDAIRLGIIKRQDIPENCRKTLGETNGNIVYSLVEDLVENSLDKPYICFSDEISNSLKELKDFNRDRIYLSETFFKQTSKLELMFSLMFERYCEELKTENMSSEIYGEYLRGMSEEYRETNSTAMVVRDFMAGMTDEYFLSQCRKHLFPEIKVAPSQSYGYMD